MVAGLVGWVAGYYQSYLSSWVGERVLLDLRTDTFRHLMRLELGYHERTPTGRTVSRLTSDIEALDQLVTDGVTSLVVNGLTFIGVVVILFVYDSQLALLTFVIFPALAVGTALFRLYSTRAYRRTRERVADVLATLQETLSGMRVVQGFGRQEPTERALRGRSTTSTARPTWPRSASRASTSRASSCWPGIGTAIILYFGSTQVLDSDLTVGVMVAFIGYLSSFFDPIQQLSPALQHLPVGDGRAGEDLRRARHRARAGATRRARSSCRRSRGEVELRGVSFGYGRAARAARRRPPHRAPARPSPWSARPAPASRRSPS